MFDPEKDAREIVDYVLSDCHRGTCEEWVRKRLLKEQALEAANARGIELHLGELIRERDHLLEQMSQCAECYRRLAMTPFRAGEGTYVVMEIVGGEWEVCSVWAGEDPAKRAAHRLYFEIDQLSPVVVLRAPLNDDTVPMEDWPEVLRLDEDGPEEQS